MDHLHDDAERRPLHGADQRALEGSAEDGQEGGDVGRHHLRVAGRFTTARLIAGVR